MRNRAQAMVKGKDSLSNSREEVLGPGILQEGIDTRDRLKRRVKKSNNLSKGL